MFKKYTLPIFKSFALIIVFGIINSAMLLIAKKIISDDNIILIGFIRLLSAVITTIIFLKAEHKDLNFIGINFKRNWYKKLFKGILTGIIFSLIFIFLLLVLREISFEGFNLTSTVYNLIIGTIVQLFTVVLVEELLYRGYILHYLNSKYTSTGAIISSSFVFAFIQVFNAYSTPLAIFNAFVLGIVFAVLLLKYDSIWAAVGFHFIWNFILGILFTSPIRGNEITGIINTGFNNFELLNGGFYGVEGGILFTVTLIVLLVYLAKKDGVRGIFNISKKNRILVFVMTIIAIFYVIYDITIWFPHFKASDNLPIKSVSKISDVNNYIMNFNLNANKKSLSGYEDVSYINNSKDNLKEIYFHMYANAFKELGGSIDLVGVKVKGENSEFKIEGQDKTLLNIPLSKELKPGERLSITLQYNINIPTRSKNSFADRFAYGNNTFNLGNCFPIAAVYENGNWDKHLYDKKGDAFYSETSNFDVKITTPKDQIIACSGNIENIETKANNKIWNIKAYAVRDFAFVSSDKFKVAEANVNGIKVKSYAFNKLKAEKVLNISCDAIKIFNKRFGEYPYGVYSAVESDINGGMEYPTMVMLEASGYDNIKFSDMLNTIMYQSPIGELEFTAVHELAHQWWYGLVGNDEFREAWIDEPLTQISSLFYYKDKYGEESFQKVYNRSIESIYKLSGFDDSKNHSMRRPLNEFGEYEYTNLIYNKGTMMFKSLNDEIGDEKFNKLLKTLFEKYEYKVVHGDELIKLTSDIAGKDMSDFYKKWLE